jgi:hypothetical protein
MRMIVTPVETQIGCVMVRLEGGSDGLLVEVTNMGAQPLKGVTLLLRESPAWARVNPSRFFYPAIPSGTSSPLQRLSLRQSRPDALNGAPAWAHPVCPLEFELSLPSIGEPKLTGALHISFA